MPATILSNANVFDGTNILADHSVVIEDGIIVDIIAGRTSASEARDLGGALLAPGFVDLQVNGGDGVLFNDAPEAETIRRIGAAHRQFGTTGFLPTLISADRQTMVAAIAASQAAMAEGVPGVLGIHLEGPFLNPARTGAHDATVLRHAEPTDIELLTRPSAGRTLVTLAPEMVGSADMVALANAGVILFAGHTNATYDQIGVAIKLGLRGFTHLFNAMSQTTAREPGVVGAALEANDCWCGIIADMHHVHAANLKLAIARRPGHVFLVTDAMPPVGADRNFFVLDGRTVTRDGSRLTLPDGTLAGSCLDMASAVRNAVDHLAIPIEEALRMASTYPATILGLGEKIGRIAPSYRADLVQLNADLRVVETWINGQQSRPRPTA